MTIVILILFSVAVALVTAYAAFIHRPKQPAMTTLAHALARLVMAAASLLSIDALIGTSLSSEPSSHLAVFCILTILEVAIDFDVVIKTNSQP
ncbi:hypothetical protein [Salinibacter ruber]|uniref:hypothetical protein n=1 Tax=Salinibacter ruber TaxID=146919 RepID=UPI002074326D|nr:hypothetical protein [Salinibacter ruber]